MFLQWDGGSRLKDKKQYFLKFSMPKVQYRGLREVCPLIFKTSGVRFKKLQVHEHGAVGAAGT